MTNNRDFPDELTAEMHSEFTVSKESWGQVPLTRY